MGTAALWQIDPGTNRVIAPPVDLGALQPVSTAASRGQLWIADYHSDTTIHFRLATR
ncbi:MAG: hypothetical protein ACRDK8_04540 [Solirubrobacteraceae bacterium]